MGEVWPLPLKSGASSSSLQIRATDADRGSFGTISYSLGTGLGNSAPAAFSLGEETGQLCTRQDLDRDEGVASYDFTITAVDGVSGSSPAQDPLPPDTSTPPASNETLTRPLASSPAG